MAKKWDNEYAPYGMSVSYAICAVSTNLRTVISSYKNYANGDSESIPEAYGGYVELHQRYVDMDFDDNKDQFRKYFTEEEHESDEERKLKEHLIKQQAQRATISRHIASKLNSKTSKWIEPG